MFKRLLLSLALVFTMVTSAKAGSLFNGPDAQLLSLGSFYHQPFGLQSSVVFLESVSVGFRTELYVVNFLVSVGDIPANSDGKLISYKFREQFGVLQSANGQLLPATRDITGWKPLYLISVGNGTTNNTDTGNSFAKPLFILPSIAAQVPWLIRTAPGSRLIIEFAGGSRPSVTADIWFIYRSVGSQSLTPLAR